jgi:DNA-binding Xre family transcriptional regulator
VRRLRDTKVPPEIDTPGWEAWHAATQLADVEYVGKMQCVVFRFADGRIFGLSLDQIEGLDPTPITRISIVYDNDVAAIEQFSGNRVEIPWDVVLYRADPTYPWRAPEPGSAQELESRQLDAAIGARVRQERQKRNLTLADLSAKTGIKIPNLSRLERGKHTPSLDTLEKVAVALGLPVAALVAR